MQKNRSKWLVGLLVLAAMIIGVAALAAPPKELHSLVPSAREKQLTHKWSLASWQNHYLSHIKDAAKRAKMQEAIKKEFATAGKTPEGIARIKKLYTEGWVDAITSSGTVTVWSNDTAYGSLVFAPANDVAHPTAISPGDSAWTGSPTPMKFFGNMLYVNEAGYIVVFDCSDVNNIQFVTYYDATCYEDGLTFDFDVHGGYLWCAMGSNGFIAFKLGDPSAPALVADPSHGSGNFGSLTGAYIDHIRVTDRTAIAVDSSNGKVWLWDITNMVDPENDVVLYPGGGNGNPWVPVANGKNAFEQYPSSPNIQFEMVQGWAFLSNSESNITNAGTPIGVSRINWADETSSDSFNAGFGFNSIDDGANGPAKYINHYAIYGTGTYVYVAFDNSNDAISGGSPDGLAGEKWDWADISNPTVNLEYRMDRFFFGYTQKVVGDNTGAPQYLWMGPFYGGASIGFSPATDPTGTYDAFVAGYDYVGAFNSAGSLTGHYTAGMSSAEWTGNFDPAGASGHNAVVASGDAFILYWYNEGFSIIDPASKIRIGGWELPGRTDWVRNVALTNDHHYALVAAGRYGLITVDLTDPTHPVTVGNWWTNPTGGTYDKQPVTYVFVPQVAGLARYAYVQTRVIVADANNAFTDHNVLRVLDISNPPLPAEVGHWDGPANQVYPYDPYVPPPLQNFLPVWDINDIQLASVYYGSQTHYWLQISNGQSGDQGHTSPLYGIVPNYDPELGNSFSSGGPVAVAGGPYCTGVGELILAEVTTPSAPTGLHAVASVLSGSYDYQSCFFANTSTANYWSYVAQGNSVGFVDLGDPASVANSQSVPLIIVGNFYHNIYTVPGYLQLLTGNMFNRYELWDVTAPLSPVYDTSVGANYFAFMSDNSWVRTWWHGDAALYDNSPDYLAPTFYGGPAGNGWITPWPPAGRTLPAQFTLDAQATDDVGVVAMAFLAVYGSPCGADPNYASDGGAILLGMGALQSDGTWALTVNNSDIPGTGWVFFVARAYDAGNNYTDSAYNGPYTVQNGGPVVTVSVSPTGTNGANYIWSTVTVSASVVNPPTATVQRVLFKVDGVSIGNGTYNPSTNLWYVNWDTTTYPDGDHILTAEATDMLGGVGVSAPVTKFVANNGPNNVLLTAPLAGSQVYGTAVPVSATVGDWPVPLDHVSFYLDRPANATSGGTLIGTATTGTPGSVKEASTIYSITWDATQVADGNHTIVAVATDKRWDGTMRNGNSTWVSFSKVTPAPLTVSITTSPASPTDATPVTAIATVGGGIAPYTYAWTVDGTAAGSNSPSITQSLAAGDHTFGLTVTDNAGTTQTASASVTVAPSVVPPVIAAVSKAGSPFRLKVSGSNFQSNAVVKINGTAVTTKFKSGSLVVAKQCKSLCPKGTAVQVTVTNPDGGVSNAVSFTR